MPELEAVDGAAIVPVRNRGGRPKGSRNKITRDLKEAACRYTLRSLRVLYKLALESPEDTVRLKAACELLDRAHGRPSTTALVGGTGDPIQTQSLVLEVSQRISQVFGQLDTTQSQPVAERLDDEGLRAVQATNFIAAQAAVKNGHQLPAVTLPLPRGETIGVPDPSTSPETGDPSPEAPEAAGSPIDVIEEPEPPEPGFTVAFVTSELSITGCPPDREGLPNVYELKRRGMLMRRAAWPVILDLAKQQSGGDLGAFIVQEPRPQAGQHFASSQDYRRH